MCHIFRHFTAIDPQPGPPAAAGIVFSRSVPVESEPVQIRVQPETEAEYRQGRNCREQACLIIPCAVLIGTNPVRHPFQRHDETAVPIKPVSRCS